MERARKEVETETRESREMKLADRAESERRVREQVREEIGKTEFRAVCGLSTFVSLHKWNCEQNLNLADHHHQNRGDHHHPHRNDLNEWFDHFKRSTIVCPSSGHPILELKFLRDGTESRYGTYFKEDRHLGTGGFGSVFKCRGLLDEQVYAVKEICIKNISFDKALREVRALSSLTYPNVVKYFQAWVEPQLYVLPKNNGEEKECDDGEDYDCDDSDDYECDEGETKEKIEAPHLYILMEYCPKTLSKHLWHLVDNNVYIPDRGCDWFRQIVTAVESFTGKGFSIETSRLGTNFWTKQIMGELQSSRAQTRSNY